MTDQGSISKTEANDADDFSVAAAYWLVRLNGEPSDADLAGFDAWIAQNPKHLAAFNTAEEMLGLLDDHSTAPEILTLRSEALGRTHRFNRKRWLGQSLHDPVRRHFLVAAAASLVAIPLGAGWWLTRKVPVEVLATGINERRTFTLSDQSKVTLDALSQVTVAYSHDLRALELTAGRAYFEVAKDASRPFKVTTDQRVVTALGTAFSVERDAQSLLVTLVEGRVAVTDGSPAQAVNMKAGESLRLSDHNAPVLTDGIDTGRALAWREGQVIFDDVDLAAAVARMNTYSRIPIVIEEAARGDGQKLGALRISGVLSPVTARVSPKRSRPISMSA